MSGITPPACAIATLLSSSTARLTSARHSRFTEAYVASREGARPAVPMLGKAGGGFVFDTNALHKGEVNGDFERTTVILEFHAHNKIRPLDGAGVPCPSAERGKRENANGVAGWPRVPAGEAERPQKVKRACRRK